MRCQISRPDATAVCFERYGTGPALVLVHGSFSDHRSNWAAVKPLLARHFQVHAVARRGRGETPATRGHSLADEGADLAAVIRAIPEPVCLLGHSYGARVALEAAATVADQVRHLVLYEPPHATSTPAALFARLRRLGEASRWEVFTETFFREGLGLPADELAQMQAGAAWESIVADAPATLEDLRALAESRFDPAACRALHMPVLLQVGTQSPRHLFITDALAGVLAQGRIAALEGQGHEGMHTAPEQYVQSLLDFLRR